MLGTARFLSVSSTIHANQYGGPGMGLPERVTNQIVRLYKDGTGI